MTDQDVFADEDGDFDEDRDHDEVGDFDGTGDGDEWGDDEVGAAWVDDDGDEWAGEDAGAEWAPPGAAGPEADEDELAAIRTVRLVAVALILSIVGVAAVFLARAVDDDDEGARSEDPTLDVEAPVSVGPPTGTPVAEYVAAQAAPMASATGRRVAVVSLVSYRAPASVDELLASIGDVEVVARLLALPGGPPTAVDAPVQQWLDEQRAPLQAERDEIAGILPTIEDPNDPFIPGYTEDLARLDAQLAALEPGAELVFGVVVRADVDTLRRLAQRAEVRVLAVGADDDVEQLFAYRGLRPEELDTAGTPPTRPR